MTNVDNTIKIKLIEPTKVEFLPRRANNDSGNACYDVTARWVKKTDKYISYGLGFATEFDSSWEFLILPRSSNSKKDLLMCNAPGVIDSNYRGEWEVRYKVVDNHNNPEIYSVGDVVAQISLKKVYEPDWKTVDTLSDSIRGEGGFGSTNANVK